MLGAPIFDKSLILYIVVQECSLRALCTQENSEGKEKTLYHLSHILIGTELSYLPTMKTTLSLMFTMKKLRHYLQVHVVCVISKADLIKYILSRLILNAELAKLTIILKQYDLVYMF